MHEPDNYFEDAARDVIGLANDLADRYGDADVWDLADGVLAGAIDFWLYSRQPCGDPACEDCAMVSTAELRTGQLRRLLAELAEGSHYYHAPTDSNAARA